VRRCDVEVALLRLALVTLGDPHRRTGGYRYHRMMAAAAADHGAELRFGSVPSLPWPVPMLPAAWTLRAATEGSDAILLDSIAAAFVAPWIRGVRTPVIAVAHQPPGGLDHGRARAAAQRALDGVAYRSAAGIIVAGEGLIDDLRAIGVASERIAFVPPGCDVPVAAGPPLDLRRGRAASVLSVANWSPSKGILELLEAFATLPQPCATLWLVGETDRNRGYTERVRRRISAPDLRDRVVVRGSVPIEEAGRLYRSADVFALCSFADAYGTAWAEALAAGLPVVGWRSGNLPRLADQGREALMAEPGDAAGLASALRAITTDRNLRDRLAAGARRRAETLPTWASAADRFFASVRGFLRSGTT
jgi:glycosyltransferase involved in cell wall biosynthesis